MGFDNSYMRTLKRSGDSFNGDKPSILHFFGFHYTTDTSSYSQTVWISDSYSRTGQSAVTGRHEDQLEGYKRYGTPTGKAGELEDRFVRLAKNRGIYNSKDVLGSEYLDPSKMPVLPLSLREYYDKHVSAPGDDEFVMGCLFGVLASALWLLVYFFVPPLSALIFGSPESTNTALLYGGPIAFCLIGYIIGKARETKLRKQYGIKVPYEHLTQSDKEAQRQAYFDYMSKQYNNEMGAVLKEYAILKGYDQI